jgi:hypothetical protein
VKIVPMLLGAAFLALAAPAAAQTEFKSICLCQLGNDPKQFSAELEVTDANRETLKKSIETGDLELRKTVKIAGDGCAAAEWRKGRFCGATSVSTLKPDGTRENTSHENTPVTGTKTLRVTNTGGIPRKQGTPMNGPMVIDDERWAKVRVIVVGGREELVNLR